MVWQKRIGRRGRREVIRKTANGKQENEEPEKARNKVHRSIERCSRVVRSIFGSESVAQPK